MCDKYSECARLMARHHLRTEADVKGFIADSEKRIDMLSQERNKVKNRLKRAKDPHRIDDLRAEQSRLTGEISAVRNELKTAKFTLDRSEKVREDIRVEHAFCRGNHNRSRKQSRNDREYER